MLYIIDKQASVSNILLGHKCTRKVPSFADTWFHTGILILFFDNRLTYTPDLSGKLEILLRKGNSWIQCLYVDASFSCGSSVRKAGAFDGKARPIASAGSGFTRKRRP